MPEDPVPGVGRPPRALPANPGLAPGGLHPAIRVAAVPLAIATALLLPPPALPAWLALLALALRLAGAAPRALAAMVRPWAPVLLLVVLVHLLTTVEAAPLGSPSPTGLLRGLIAAARLLGIAAALALALRALPLPVLVAGLAWWEPRRRPRLAARLGVALTVAAGTAATAAQEGRRIDAAVRLRRGGARRHPAARPWGRALDAGYLVVPLIESLLRRADALTLALQGRVPGGEGGRRPRAVEAVALLLWTAVLIWGFVWLI